MADYLGFPTISKRVPSKAIYVFPDSSWCHVDDLKDGDTEPYATLDVAYSMSEVEIANYVRNWSMDNIP